MSSLYNYYYINDSSHPLHTIFGERSSGTYPGYGVSKRGFKVPETMENIFKTTSSYASETFKDLCRYDEVKCPWHKYDYQKHGNDGMFYLYKNNPIITYSDCCPLISFDRTLNNQSFKVTSFSGGFIWNDTFTISCIGNPISTYDLNEDTIEYMPGGDADPSHHLFGVCETFFKEDDLEGLSTTRELKIYKNSSNHIVVEDSLINAALGERVIRKSLCDDLNNATPRDIIVLVQAPGGKGGRGGKKSGTAGHGGSAGACGVFVVSTQGLSDYRPLRVVIPPITDGDAPNAKIFIREPGSGIESGYIIGGGKRGADNGENRDIKGGVITKMSSGMSPESVGIFNIINLPGGNGPQKGKQLGGTNEGNVTCLSEELKWNFPPQPATESNNPNRGASSPLYVGGAGGNASDGSRGSLGSGGGGGAWWDNPFNPGEYKSGGYGGFGIAMIFF